MARTINCNEEIIVVSEGMKDLGKLAMLGCDGKFHFSVIPNVEREVQVCKVVRTSPQSIPINAVSNDTRVIFQAVEFGVSDMFDIAHPTRITIPSDGIYQLIGQVYSASEKTGGRGMAIRLNGQLINIAAQTITASDNHTHSQNCSMFHMLIKGDYIELIFNHNVNPTMNISSGASLSAYKISV